MTSLAEKGDFSAARAHSVNVGDIVAIHAEDMVEPFKIIWTQFACLLKRDVGSMAGSNSDGTVIGRITNVPPARSCRSKLEKV